MLQILDVPRQFQPDFPFPYPGHQTGKLIEQFVDHYLQKNQDSIRLDRPWTYVPVYWTSGACCFSRLPRWQRRLRRGRLDRWLRKNLTPGVNYFTVSLHDDGLRRCAMVQPAQPILEFSCGGTGDIPLPLLCDPHTPIDLPRDIRASFVGAISNPTCRYPCREAMARALAGQPEYQIIDVQAHWGENDRWSLGTKTRDFVEIMCRSIFTLCPRGYGKTSFRMYEAMQLGSIPVYLYDDPWLPYADVLDWNEFSVLVPLAEVPRLHEILASKTSAEIARMQQRIAELQYEYFTPTATVKQMLRMMQGRAATGPA